MWVEQARYSVILKCTNVRNDNTKINENSVTMIIVTLLTPTIKIKRRLKVQLNPHFTYFSLFYSIGIQNITSYQPT